MNIRSEIIYKDNFIENASELYCSLRDGLIWDERMQSRKTASFGVAYEYSGITYPETAIHTELLPICNTIEADFGWRPNNCLLNYYPDGSSKMGFHSDSSEKLDPGSSVIIISIGSERSLVFKNKMDRSQKVEYRLKPGSLLLMSIALQEEWLHAIPSKENAGGRISLTFRNIRKGHG